MIQLEDWGWDAGHEGAFQALPPHEDLAPARVIEEQRDGYTVVCTSGETRAYAAGRLRHHADGKEALPAVGDWVAIGPVTKGGRTVIHAVLPRRTALVRKEAGRTATAQVIATNVDIAFLVTSLNSDLEPRRLERYLAAIWDSGAQPVLVLNKADLCEDPQAVLDEIGPVALGVPVVVVSALHGQGAEQLEAHLAPGSTVLLVGSSGVGKSTLVNRLAGESLQYVHVIRERDERGQHTTTARRLLRLPSGALLVDTPGMRELALWDADEGLDEAFDDLTTLFTQCRFTDCGHGNEPGCAVQAAVEAGTLDPGRLGSWKKLQRELAHLRSKTNKREQAARKREFKTFTKSIRQNTKDLKRRRGLDR